MKQGWGLKKWAARSGHLVPASSRVARGGRESVIGSNICEAGQGSKGLSLRPREKKKNAIDTVSQKAKRRLGKKQDGHGLM